MPIERNCWLDRLETRLGGVATLLLVALAIQVISFLLYPYPLQEKLERYVRYQTMVVLCENPFTTEQLSEPTVRHRLLVPLLAWPLQLRGNGYLILIYSGSYLFILLTLVLLRQMLPWKQAAMTTLLLATTLAVTTTTSWPTFQDTWSNAAIVACLLLRKQWWLMGPVLYVGMLADERCITTVPLLLLWFYFEDAPEERRKLLQQRLMSVTLAAICYAATYYGIHRLDVPSEKLNYYGFKEQTGFIQSILKGDVFLKQIMYAPAGLWFALRAGWLLIIMLWWSRRKEQWFRTWLLGGLVVAVGHSLLVEDVSRVASLAFPAMLLAVVLLYRQSPRLTTQLLGVCLLVNVLSPQYQINHNRSSLLIPLPLQALRLLQAERSGIAP